MVFFPKIIINGASPSSGQEGVSTLINQNVQAETQPPLTANISQDLVNFIADIKEHPEMLIIPAIIIIVVVILLL